MPAEEDEECLIGLDVRREEGGKVVGEGAGGGREEGEGLEGLRGDGSQKPEVGVGREEGVELGEELLRGWERMGGSASET